MDLCKSFWLVLSHTNHYSQFLLLRFPTKGGRIQRQFLPKRVFTHQRAGRNLIAADMGRFGYEADVCQLSASR